MGSALQIQHYRRLVNNKIKTTARRNLDKFLASQPEYLSRSGPAASTWWQSTFLQPPPEHRRTLKPRGIS
jgi:hypothetical protein